MGYIEKSILIEAPIDLCYRLWAGFESFPSFMKYVKHVSPTDSPNVWHWVIDGPMGTDLSWDARVDIMEPDQQITWHSLDDAMTQVSGKVRFEKVNASLTTVSLTITYHLPAGSAGELVAELIRSPAHMAEEELSRFRERTLLVLKSDQQAVP